MSCLLGVPRQPCGACAAARVQCAHFLHCARDRFLFWADRRPDGGFRPPTELTASRIARKRGKHWCDGLLLGHHSPKVACVSGLTLEFMPGYFTWIAHVALIVTDGGQRNCVN
jgi:hypothetical protein